MTSIKGRLDQGILIECDVEFFKLNKGQVPLCCCEIRLADPKTFEKLKEPLYKCDQLKQGIPMSEFRPFCLKCQDYIKRKLGERNDITL